MFNRDRMLLSRLLIAFVGALLTTLPACKTTEGAGKDLENLGENIQDAAD